MTNFYAFNGDADGLCALQQLRLADAAPAELITGVKRDIELLQRVPAKSGDCVTVLDVSLDSNRAGLMALLEAGARVRYFDHHHAGAIPEHALLEAHINLSPEVCTSLLVDDWLGGSYRAWAAVAAFGDSLPKQGQRLAALLGLTFEQSAILERLGVTLNYNAYGESVADLYFDPAELAARMLPFQSPFDFVAASPDFARLWDGYQSDMALARSLPPYRQHQGALLIILPDAAWARRVIGVLANELMHRLPESAVAILSPRTNGYLVSVRVPKHAATGADEFCRRFASGGGRRGAAGINLLPSADVDLLADRFLAEFARG